MNEGLGVENGARGKKYIYRNGRNIKKERMEKLESRENWKNKINRRVKNRYKKTREREREKKGST